MQVHRYAFEMARKKKANRITCGHKANIMKLTDGLFLETFYEVANEYPDLLADDVIVDDLCMKLVVMPNTFDVVVLPNLQGDIVSDLCAGLVGGLGFAPSANIGDDICIFEAVHGTAPDITGKGIANPTALLLSGLMMLRHIGLTEHAAMIENSLLAALESGLHTSDFGADKKSAVNTKLYTDTIIEKFGEMPVHAKPAVGLHNSLRLQHKDSPLKNILIQSGIVKTQLLAGVDLFVEFSEQPAELAALIQRLTSDHYNLSTISNRGTQVWPTGSVYTNCVNQFRVRLEKKNAASPSQEDIFNTCILLSKHIRICSTEMLLEIDGKKAYSMAQGQ